ncbi:hypothetical protein BJV74DRAFT_887642 [Russula compacta]|nr:hypothetical protein BJV74DRAFT_887642 [Russula compacta]
MPLRFDDDSNKETPLLHVQTDKTPHNPTLLPTTQIAVLAFPSVAEGIMQHSISPYLNQLVQDLPTVGEMGKRWGTTWES